MTATPSTTTDAVASALRRLPLNASRQSRRIVAEHALREKPRRTKTIRGLVTTIRHGCDHDWMLARYEVRLLQWQGVARDGAAKTWARFWLYNLENGNRHTVDVFVGLDGELMATCDETCVMFSGLEHGTCLHCEFFLSGLEEAIRANGRALELLGLDGLMPAMPSMPPAAVPLPAGAGYAARAARTEGEFQEARAAMHGNRFTTATSEATTASVGATQRAPQPVSAEDYAKDWRD